MYCIINQTNDIIAADINFLAIFETKSLMELYKKISSGLIKIGIRQTEIKITIGDRQQNFPSRVVMLNTLFGQSVLIELQEPNIASTSNNEIFTQNSVIQTPQQPTQEAPEVVATASNTEVVNTPTAPTPQEEKEELQELKVSLANLNITQIASQMHLSEKEYNSFLDEYVNAVNRLRSDLQSTDTQAKTNALNFIKHITLTLGLPTSVQNYIGTLDASSSHEAIETLFDIINSIQEQKVLKSTSSVVTNENTQNQNIQLESSTQTPQNNIIKLEQPQTTYASPQPLEISIEPITDSNEQKMQGVAQAINPQGAMQNFDSGINLENQQNLANTVSLNTTNITPENITQPPTPTPSIQPQLNDTIDLGDTKPIPFDFIIDESAKELSLPVDIVKEFINDFIEQCHEETKKIISQYEDGDLAKIQKLAHSLKGVASNLYITPLADTLLDLQTNNDIGRVKPLVKQYWGQCLYLENIIKRREL